MAAAVTPAAEAPTGALTLRMSPAILSPLAVSGVSRPPVVIAVSLAGEMEPGQRQGPGQGQGQRELTLPAVLDAVLRANPALIAKRSRLDAAVQDVATFKRRFYPSASVTAQSRSSSQGGAVAELSVRQPLYTFGALTADVETAQKQAEVNRWDLLAQERTTQADAVEAARQLEEARALAAVVQLADAKYQAFNSMMMRRVQGGVSAPIEAELLRGRQVQNDVNKNRFESQAKDAAAKLEQLTGDALDRTVLLAMADADADTQVRVFLGQINPKLAELVQTVPAVLSSQLKVDVEEQRLRAQKAKLLPRLELAWTQQFAQNGAQLASDQRSGRASLLFSADTTAGLSGWAGLQADATRLSALMREVDAKAREVELELRLALNALELELEREPFLLQAVVSNEEVLASYERQFAVGRKSWLEVLNAVRELQTTQLDLVRNRMAQKYAMIRLRVQLGFSPLDQGI